MNIFNKIFNKSNPTKEQKSEKKQYLFGWEVNFDDSKHCQSFIETQITTEKSAKNAYCYIEMIFNENNFLEEAIKRDEDGNEELLSFDLDKIPYKDLRINEIYNFIEDKNGLNYIGGKIPQDFKIPVNKCPGSFQYLGLINHNSLRFEWLPFDINLISPIYMDMDKVWLDYSSSKEPKIINLDEINSLTTAYDDLIAGSFVTYCKKPFSTVLSTDIEYGIGATGIPNWIQFSDIPRCPKSGKTMRFLCQLQSDIVNTSETNVVNKDEWYKSYFEKMNFWGGGDLYVFFEPETKIACYMIQNT